MFVLKQDYLQLGYFLTIFLNNFLIISFTYFRAEREYVIQEDFMKAVRKVADNKKLESKLDYKPV